jgi:hypothetical protein
MRTLLLTLLLVAPLLAQEAEEQKPAEQDKAAQLRKLVESFLATHKDEKDLKKLEEGLRALLRSQVDDVTIFPRIVSQDLSVFFDSGWPGGQETISGSSDGTSYTMKSLGGGRYKLTAKQEVRDGETKQITDEGTLKELSKKYSFLKGIFALRVPYADVTMMKTDGSAPGFFVREHPKARLGMLVRPPSESLSHHLELPTGAGLVVASVTKGSRAEKLGLKEHDVLLRIDGELIDSPDQLKRLDKNKGVLVYVRRAKPRTLDLSKLADDEK